MKSKFILHVAAGTYQADTLFSLFVQVISHKFYHLKNDGKWMD